MTWFTKQKKEYVQPYNWTQLYSTACSVNMQYAGGEIWSVPPAYCTYCGVKITPEMICCSRCGAPKEKE